MGLLKYSSLFLAMLYSITSTYGQHEQPRTRITVKITASDNQVVDYAVVYLKDTNHNAVSKGNGEYHFSAPRGKYIMVVSAIGYQTAQTPVTLSEREQSFSMEIEPKATEIEEVVIAASGVDRINHSAYNAIAVDIKSLHNSSLDLAHSLVSIPGVKLRESGGLGSDMKFSLDGFSGRHVKFFIDGIPMDGMGSSFGINNIPVNFADRIEVYKGVVPVSFGSDAIGGVVNIVTTQKRRTYIDASYSYGSFNTHKSYVSFGHTTGKGFAFEAGAFQNYSDNNYKISTPVEDLDNGQIDRDRYETVKRFHDTYHNETLMAKAGIVGKGFADRLMLGVNLSQSDKEIQNGVRQEIVFGEKRTKSQSVMPSIEYIKRNLFTENLDVRLTANYNRNTSHNIDTSAYRYNWRGESILTRTVGEQRYQNSEFTNDNWNITFNTSYRFFDNHSLTLNHVMTAMDRKTTATVDASTSSSGASDFNKRSRKNITGLSYRFNHRHMWNISVFGKYYNQYGSGPVSTSSDGYTYEMYSGNVDNFGYGAAGTVFISDFQVKASYEKALRLPTTDEMFGDEDLERGTADLKPERSNNYNLSISYSKTVNRHMIFAEVGALYRLTKDYIKRSVDRYSGGLYFGSHMNFGRVETTGFNVELRYNYSKWLTLGGSLTHQNIRDHEKWIYKDVSRENPAYKARIPNIPYFFTNSDVSFHIHNLFHKGNMLTVTYDNLYVHHFPLYTQRFGAADEKIIIPSQFTHNLSLVYNMNQGSYNIALECRNFTNEKVYDNYSLQKAGRAFYVKFRYFFSR